MTEICVLDADGVELGFVSSKRSRWIMDEDGVFRNAEPVVIITTVPGKPASVALRGRHVTRLVGPINCRDRSREGDLIKMMPGDISIFVLAEGDVGTTWRAP